MPWLSSVIAKIINASTISSAVRALVHVQHTRLLSSVPKCVANHCHVRLNRLAFWLDTEIYALCMAMRVFSLATLRQASRRLSDTPRDTYPRDKQFTCDWWFSVIHWLIYCKTLWSICQFHFEIHRKSFLSFSEHILIILAKPPGPTKSSLLQTSQ